MVEWTFGMPEGETVFYISYEAEGRQVRQECGYMSISAPRALLRLDKQGAFSSYVEADAEIVTYVPCSQWSLRPAA